MSDDKNKKDKKDNQVVKSVCEKKNQEVRREYIVYPDGSVHVKMQGESPTWQDWDYK